MNTYYIAITGIKNWDVWVQIEARDLTHAKRKCSARFRKYRNDNNVLIIADAPNGNYLSVRRAEFGSEWQDKRDD